MMKKLFMWSALLMTGFAFYSCDDVIDNPANPAENESSVWNYTVSVKFAEFKDAMDNPIPFDAPTTLYVFNEKFDSLGAITTETAPTGDNYGSYTGKLVGSIGENLIISTATISELAKQDGTQAAALKYGIIQTDTVPVTIYSTLSEKVSTSSAKLENTGSIVHLDMGWLTKDDEVTIESDNLTTLDKSFTFKIKEGAPVYDLYVAIPTAVAAAADYTISVNAAKGEISEVKMEALNLAKGKINTLVPSTNEPYHIMQKVQSVDLTKYWQWQKKTNPNATGEYTYFINPFDGAEITLTQSGTATLDSLRISGWGANATDKVTINLKDVKLGKDRNLNLGVGEYTINLIGDNEFGQLAVERQAKCTTKGDGTLKYNVLNLTDNGSGVVTDMPEFTIDKNIDLKQINNQNGKLTIAEGVIVNVTVTEEIDPVMLWENASLTLAKGAELNVESKVKDRALILADGQQTGPSTYVGQPTITLEEGAKITGQGAKENTGMVLWNAILNVGKGAKVYLQGGLDNEYGIGTGARLNDATVILADSVETEFTAIGIDRTGLEVNGITTITTNGKAKFIAKNKYAGNGVVVYSGNTLNINGTGTFTASASKKAAVVGGNLNIGTGSIVEFTQLAGATESAVIVEEQTGAKMAIAADVKSVTVTSGQATDPIYIETNAGWTWTEIPLANLVTTPANFNDTKADGKRTITPKPAAP